MAYTYNYRMSSFFHIFKILPQGILQVFLFPSLRFIFVVLLYNYVNFVYDDMLFDIVFGCRDERCVNNNYTFKYHPFLPLPIRCIYFSFSPSLSLEEVLILSTMHKFAFFMFFVSTKTQLFIWKLKLSRCALEPDNVFKNIMSL